MGVTKIMKGCSAVLAAAVMASMLVIPSENVDAGLTSGGKFLGNIIAGSVPSNFATYWNQVTPENASKWGSVESNRDSMNWGGVDTSYKYAKSNHFPFKFHTLVWGSQEPSNWINNISAADKKAEVLEWIQAAGERYGDSELVDVVNEPLHAKPTFRDAIGGDGSTGWDWVIWSFEQARKYFKGKLLINEYGIISDPNATENYLKIIRLLKERGLVDGIGIQCHQFNMNTVSTNTMKSILDKLAATGLPIYVSELDMDGDDNTQLNLYKQKFPVLWEHPAVQGITLWGYIQGQTWKNNTHLLNSVGQERPAMKWLKEYLSSHQNPTPTTKPTPKITPTPKATATPRVTPTPVVTQFPENLLLQSMAITKNNEYTMNFDITNTSRNDVSSWTVTLKQSEFQIGKTWNAKMTKSGEYIIIKPVAWNGIIMAGDTVSFAVRGIGKAPTDFWYTVK